MDYQIAIYFTYYARQIVGKLPNIDKDRKILILI